MAGILAIGLWGDPNNAIHTGLANNLMFGLWGIIAFYIGAPVADDFLQAKTGIVGKANDLLQERNAILSGAPRGGSVAHAAG